MHEHHGHQHPAHGPATPGIEADHRAVDPVCGMKVAPTTAHRATLAGEEYLFCSARCAEKFRASPEKYAQPAAVTPEPAAAPGAVYACPMHPEVRQVGPGSCPKPRTIVAEPGPDPELRVMIDMRADHAISDVLTRRGRVFLELALATPVCTYAAWPFYVRAVQSVSDVRGGGDEPQLGLRHRQRAAPAAGRGVT